MGGDGGSIPGRADLVKTRTKPEQVGRSVQLLAKWKHCAISQEPLRTPIVACELGRLYNKEAILEFLLDRSKLADGTSRFAHLRGLRDIHELKLTDNPEFVAEASKGGDDKFVSPYICPVAGLEMNGHYRFAFLFHCGCVFSERALNQIKDSTCVKCGSHYDADDVILLNPSDEETAELRIRMESRRLAAKSAKETRKRKVPDSSSTSAQSTAAGCESQPTTSADAEPKSTTVDGPASKQLKTASAAAKSATSSAGKTTLASSSGKKVKSIQDDPNATEVYKKLFNSHESAKRQQTAHWVTYNPQYF